MSKVVMLHAPESEEILLSCIEKKVPAIMSYLSKDKWHVAKVLLTDLAANRLTVEGCGWREKPRPINIQVNQPVGISFKYEYGKFVFDTTVVALEPSPDQEHRGQGGRIVLAVPDRMEVIQRRSYFRVKVPESLNVNVTLWHRSQTEVTGPRTQDPHEQRAMSGNSPNYYQGKLVDISAGGAQVMIPHQDEAMTRYSSNIENPASRIENPGTQRPGFKKGQFIGLRFTPMPYERPLMFNAQIRNILPAEDHKSIYLGLQIVGLEASAEGRQVLSRITSVVERYYQLNLSGTKQLDMQTGLFRTVP
ncbi:MAG: flagellar brake protein [Sedimentisphaerales bacterium]